MEASSIEFINHLAFHRTYSVRSSSISICRPSITGTCSITTYIPSAPWWQTKRVWSTALDSKSGLDPPWWKHLACQSLTALFTWYTPFRSPTTRSRLAIVVCWEISMPTWRRLWIGLKDQIESTDWLVLAPTDKVPRLRVSVEWLSSVGTGDQTSHLALEAKKRFWANMAYSCYWLWTRPFWSLLNLVRGWWIDTP